MQQARVLVLWGYGINCEEETALTFKRAGADEVRLVHIGELLRGEVDIFEYNIFAFPGGFLDGDHLGAAKACANRFRYGRMGGGKRIIDALVEFVERGGYIIGICNGFQLLVKLGLLPALSGNYGDVVLTLSANDSGMFEDRWVYLKVLESPCAFTQGFDKLYFPVRHGEGKLIAKDQRTLERLFEEGHVVLQYADPNFNPTMEYPFNPNGSQGSIAGLCDPTGRIFGLMPHPEAFNIAYNHPRWTRGEGFDIPNGVDLFSKVIKRIKGGEDDQVGADL